jgi:hypothetical protein
LYSTGGWNGHLMTTSGTKITKNGHDQIQDRDIRELRELVLEYKEDNSKQHEYIVSLISSIQGDVKAASWVGRVLWGVVFIFITFLGAFLGWAATQIYDLGDEIKEVRETSRSHIASDAIIANNLRHDIDVIEVEIKEAKQDHKEDIRQLQRFHGLLPSEEDNGNGNRKK